MKAFLRFLGKETREMMRTWRLPVLIGMTLFFAATGPLLALYTPQLLESFAQQQPGAVIQVPDPTWRDAYLQWAGNLSEIVALVTLIIGAGSVAGEVAGGTATLVLTKPVSRSSFVLAKATALYGLVAATVIAGAALTQGLTLVLFGEAPGADVWAPTALWLVFAAVLVALATLCSTLMPTLAAAGTSLAVFLVTSGLGFLEPVKAYSPVGLMTGASDLLLGKEPVLVWPIVSGIAAVVVLLAAASASFSQREL